MEQAKRVIMQKLEEDGLVTDENREGLKQTLEKASPNDILWVANAFERFGAKNILDNFPMERQGEK